MPVFDYRAVSAQGEVKTGQMNAAKEHEVVAYLQGQNLIPMSLKEARSAPGTSNKLMGSFFPVRLKQRDITEFTRQLSILVGAGLPLDRGLLIISGVSTNPPLVELIDTLQSEIRGGAALSTALEQFPKLFPVFYINLVRAAEASGNLAHSLSEISIFLDKSQAQREQLVSALVYPMILVGVTLLSLAIIMIFVLPEFSQLFEDMDAPLPASTAFVLGVADGVRQYWWAMCAVVAGIVAYYRFKQQDEAWLYRRDARLLNSSLTSDLIKKINIARFSRSLGTLLEGGVPLLSALKIAKDGLQNRVLVAELDAVVDSLQDGSSLAAPLLATGVFPEFALQMIQVGEETGKLDEMLVRVADIYDGEVSTATQRMLSILEPVMIIGLGVVIGGIIMSILMAILGINDLPM